MHIYLRRPFWKVTDETPLYAANWHTVETIYSNCNHSFTCKLQNTHHPWGGMAHLGLDASSPSRCSSCSGPPRSASPGMGGARCALRTGGSCNSGSVQWLPCRTGPQACRETECRGGNEARENQNTLRRKLKSPTHLPGKILQL